jgi:hypothetical protein
MGHKTLLQDFPKHACLSKNSKNREKKNFKSQPKAKSKIQPSKFSQPSLPTPNLRAMFAPGSAPPLFLHPLARHRIGRRAVARLLEVIGGEVEGNEGGPGVLQSGAPKR